MGVVCGAIDHGVGSEVFAVVDHDGPELDEDEEGEVGEFLEGEDEGKEVVWDGLNVSKSTDWEKRWRTTASRQGGWGMRIERVKGGVEEYISDDRDSDRNERIANDGE